MSPENIVPVSPRLIAGRDGIELFFQRFRSSHQKDFGWRFERMVYAGSSWSEPETVSPFQGMPDTRYGVAALPDDRRLLAHNATEYIPMHTRERMTAGLPRLRAGSAPVDRERIEILTLEPSDAAVAPPVRVELSGYEGARRDTRGPPRRPPITVGPDLPAALGRHAPHSHPLQVHVAQRRDAAAAFRWAVDHNAWTGGADRARWEYMSYNGGAGSRRRWRPSPAAAASGPSSASRGNNPATQHLYTRPATRRRATGASP